MSVKRKNARQSERAQAEALVWVHAYMGTLNSYDGGVAVRDLAWLAAKEAVDDYRAWRENDG